MLVYQRPAKGFCNHELMLMTTCYFNKSCQTVDICFSSIHPDRNEATLFQSGTVPVPVLVLSLNCSSVPGFDIRQLNWV